MSLQTVDMVLSASHVARGTLAAPERAHTGSFDKMLTELRTDRLERTQAREEQARREPSRRREEEPNPTVMADASWQVDHLEQTRVQIPKLSRSAHAGAAAQSGNGDLLTELRMRLTLGAKSDTKLTGDADRTTERSAGASKAFDLLSDLDATQKADASKPSRRTRAAASNLELKAQAMRKQLQTQVAEYTARSIRRFESTTQMTQTKSVPAPTLTSALAASHQEVELADEPDVQTTPKKVSAVMAEVAGMKSELVDGAGATLKATPVQNAEAPAPISERIVQHIERVMAQSQRQMTVSMGDLGDVRISIQRLAMNQAGLHVVLEATDSRASQLLSSQLGQLNESLQQRGYSDAVVDVRDADAESTGFGKDQAKDQSADAQDEAEQHDAELAAAKRISNTEDASQRKRVQR